MSASHVVSQAQSQHRLDAMPVRPSQQLLWRQPLRTAPIHHFASEVEGSAEVGSAEVGSAEVGSAEVEGSADSAEQSWEHPVVRRPPEHSPNRSGSDSRSPVEASEHPQAPVTVGSAPAPGDLVARARRTASSSSITKRPESNGRTA